MVAVVAEELAVVYFSSSLDRTRRPCHAVHDSDTGTHSKAIPVKLHTARECRFGNRCINHSSYSATAPTCGIAGYL